jgi:hypothetical protein
MKTSLEIINKLSEKEAVKLDSQLVELGIADDLEKELVNIGNLRNPIAKNIDRITNLSIQLRDEKKLANENLIKLNSTYEKGMVLYEKVKKMQDELGIKLPIVGASFSMLKGAEVDYKELKTSINQAR